VNVQAWLSQMSHYHKNIYKKQQSISSKSRSPSQRGEKVGLLIGYYRSEGYLSGAGRGFGLGSGMIVIILGLSLSASLIGALSTQGI
jgi:hypothetical protein